MPGTTLATQRLRRRRLPPISPILCLVLLLVPLTPPLGAAGLPAVRGDHGMVVSPERHATAAGIRVLERGGTAVDAAVAVAFSLAVTYPLAGNLGGGGFMLVRDENGAHHALDFRERAPLALDPAALVDEDGRPLPGISLDGGLAVGTPGTVRGLELAHERWGRQGWSELMRPAIALAKSGFEIGPWMAETLEASREKLARDPDARTIFFDADGSVLGSGDRLRQPALARTLRGIARRGADDFYEGPTALALVETVARHGGVLTLRDLDEYRPRWREPMRGSYRGYEVVSFPPPSSGGVALLQILGMLEGFDLAASGSGSSRTVHLIAEAERRAFADRSRWLGDPDFYPTPAAKLLDARYLEQRAASIAADRATPSKSIDPGEPGRSIDAPGETLHFSVTDADGRAVSLTTTLNRWYGCGIVARGTGVLLNNEIDDFSLAPGFPNSYGLLGGEANAVAGGKRPLSSMTPTIVEFPGGGPQAALVLGSPGGSTIITSVAQVLINVIDHAMPIQQAVDAPRFHHQWYPDTLRHEARAFPADVADGLRDRGHSLEVVPRHLGNVNAIAWQDGAWRGAADPRRLGSADGY